MFGWREEKILDRNKKEVIQFEIYSLILSSCLLIAFLLSLSYMNLIYYIFSRQPSMYGQRDFSLFVRVEVVELALHILFVI